MSEKKTIAVVGATGAQGGGLVRAILAEPDGEFAVRAITRNAGSDKARRLAELGAEVVEADLDDEASVRKAFDGAHGVFLVTNFWENLPDGTERSRADMEIDQAAVGARAAKDAGVRHVIWSTLEDTREHLPLNDDRLPTLHGKYTVPHFDAKAEANGLFVELGVPTTFLQTSMFYEAFKQGMGPQRGGHGELVLTLPMGEAKLAGIAAEDIGKTALGVFKRGEEFVGKTVSIAGDHLTGAEVATAMSKAFGEEVTYRPLTHDQFRALGFPLADEIGNMFQYYAEAADYFTGVRDLDLVRELNPEVQTLDTWLEANKSDIPTS
jgi:uncharacterized protein YbjT (DUF2867 family)